WSINISGLLQRVVSMPACNPGAVIESLPIIGSEIRPFICNRMRGVSCQCYRGGVSNSLNGGIQGPVITKPCSTSPAHQNCFAYVSGGKGCRGAGQDVGSSSYIGVKYSSGVSFCSVIFYVENVGCPYPSIYNPSAWGCRCYSVTDKIKLCSGGRHHYAIFFDRNGTTPARGHSWIKR